MATFFSTQLDFIFFFYGLAFILLGTVCFAIARGGSKDIPWRLLGLFSFIHGLAEWLDLTALFTGDTPVFAAARTGVMTLSYVFLLEFARVEASTLGYRVPGRWIYGVLLLAGAVAGATGGVDAGNAVIRYGLSLPGALGTAAVLALHFRSSHQPGRQWALLAAIGFALYSIAAGVFVPEATFWPTTIVNDDEFFRITETPIQFTRGVLACWIAFSIWAFWGQQLVRDVASAQFTRFMRRQFVLMLATMSLILVVGWALTEYFGGTYQHNVEAEARGDLDLIASRLWGETTIVDGMAKALAGSPSVQAALGGRTSRDTGLDALVALHVEASGAKSGYVLDRSGTTIASAGSKARDEALRRLDSGSFIRKSLGGEPAFFYAAGSGNERSYFASVPVRAQSGDLIGTVVLQRSLEAFANDLSLFDRPIYMVDANGVVMLTNRPDMMLRPLWPLSPKKRQTMTARFGTTIDTPPLLAREVVGDAWVTVDGAKAYVRHQAIRSSDWSLLLVTMPDGIVASRLLGIIITLQMATLMLAYLVGRQRWIHDNIQIGKRQELEETARDLDVKATTDPLTGQFNRLKFDEELGIEMKRAERYRSPLSLILFDFDNFKGLNDSHGHLAGDQVLIEATRFVNAHIRDIDMLARWGGEEFVILVPGCDLDRTRRIAEKLRDGIAAYDFGSAGPVTCSFGIARFEAGDSAESLIARADRALYRAKMKGRNRVEVSMRTEPVESAA